MRNAKLVWGLALGVGIVAFGCGEDNGECVGVGTRTCIDLGGNPQRAIQEALVSAQSGDVIQLPAGTYDLTLGLSLSASGVTVRGEGMDKTILSFKNQEAGAEGLLAKGDSLVFEEFTIQDPKGDALKVEGGTGVTFRRVKAEWTGGPDESNGAYGLYPVQCTNVLIEDSMAVAASDAGIYVGQSKNIIVRRNRVESNVAGIEIENSQNADVYENVATNNTGGILIFDLPGLQVKDGRNIRVFNNTSLSNNTKNFAAEGNIVGIVPTGTGMLVMANNNVEIFGNTIQDNDTVNLAVVSYQVTGLSYDDPDYDAYPETIHVHDNTFVGGGNKPDLSGDLGLLSLVLGGALPDIVYDGILDPRKAVDGALPADLKLCIQGNGDADFANVDAGPLLARDFENAKIVQDLKLYDCAHPAVSPVAIPGVE